MIDCSLEAQDGRRAALVLLRAKLYAGVASIADRSRSISYHNADTLSAAIARLEREIAYCDGTPRGRRLSYVPLIKGL